MMRVERRWRPALLTPAFVVVVLFPRVSHSQVTVMGHVVVGETGAALEGATVTLKPRPGTQSERRGAQTDENGRFRWDQVPAGQYLVCIDAEGYLEETREVTVGDQEVQLALSVLRGPDLKGRILRPDGQPLAEHDVSFDVFTETGPAKWTGVPRAIRTDGEGRFRLGVHRFGRWKLMVLAPGVGYSKTDPFSVRSAEEPPELTLELNPVSTISGCVVAKDTGEPVAGAHVRAFPVEPRGVATDDTGPDGSFTLSDLAPGMCPVSVSADGFRPSRTEVTIGEGEDVTDIVVEIARGARGATVRGRVFGPDGRTRLANAKVSLYQGPWTETDAGGRFTLENVGPGHYTLTARAEGFAPTKHELEVVEGEDPPEQRIVFRARGGTITGRVVDADANKPLEGEVVVVVEAEQDEEDDADRVPSIVDMDPEMFDAVGVPRDSPFRTETDAEGRYELVHIPAGAYVVAVIRGPGLGLWQKGVEVREGETTADVNFEVRRKMPGVLTVRLVLPGGKPLANRSVERTLEYQGNGQSGGGSGRRDTDSHGCFYDQLRGSGKYEVEVQFEGYMLAHAELRVDDANASPELTIELEPIPPGGPPAGRISGHVFMPDGVTPAEGVFVEPFTRNAPFPGATGRRGTGDDTYRYGRGLGTHTSGDGSFTIEDLPPGRYGVVAFPGERPAERETSVVPEWRYVIPAVSDLVDARDGEETTGLRIVLGAGGSIVVTVIDAETNDPVPQAPVWCRASGFWERPPFWDSPWDGNTGAAGQARFDQMAPGTYGVEVRAPGYERAMQRDVQVEADEDTVFELMLQPTME